MGRLWLALVLVIALVASAFAYRPRVPEPASPMTVRMSLAPRVTGAYLEVAPQRASNGLFEVERLRIDASFGPSVIHVRISIGTLDDRATIDTTPDHLDLVAPQLFSQAGTVRLYVRGVDATRHESRIATIDVVATQHVPTRCGEGFGFLMLFGVVLGLLVILGTLFAMRAIEIQRTRARRATEPTPLPAPAAEEHIRTVALRALLALAVVTAVLVVSIGVAVTSSADVLFIPIFGGPVLAIVGIAAIVRVVNAGRAIALLHRPGAAASTRFDQLEVVAGGRHVTLRSSPALVKRARRHALPRATL